MTKAGHSSLRKVSVLSLIACAAVLAWLWATRGAVEPAGAAPQDVRDAAHREAVPGLELEMLAEPEAASAAPSSRESRFAPAEVDTAEGPEMIDVPISGTLVVQVIGKQDRQAKSGVVVRVFPSDGSPVVGRDFVQSTAQDGSAMFRDLLPGRYTAAYLLVGFKVETDVRVGEVALAEIQVPEMCRVRGTVRDRNGNPMPGAEIRAIFEGRANGDRAVAFADERGVFEIESIVDLPIYGVAKGFLPSPIEPLRACDAGRIVDVDLVVGGESACHRFLVVDDKGLPLEGALVRVEGRGRGANDLEPLFRHNIAGWSAYGGPLWSGLTDADGRVELCGLPREELAVSVRQPGREVAFVGLDAKVVESEPTRVVLGRGVTVSGQITHHDGSPAVGVVVSCGGRWAFDACWTMTRADGSYHLSGLHRRGRAYELEARRGEAVVRGLASEDKRSGRLEWSAVIP
jgi:hypothetical protein